MTPRICAPSVRRQALFGAFILHALLSCKYRAVLLLRGAKRLILFLLYRRSSQSTAGVDQIPYTAEVWQLSAGVPVRHGDAINMALPDVCYKFTLGATQETAMDTANQALGN